MNCADHAAEMADCRMRLRTARKRDIARIFASQTGTAGGGRRRPTSATLAMNNSSLYSPNYIFS